MIEADNAGKDNAETENKINNKSSQSERWERYKREPNLAINNGHKKIDSSFTARN